MGRLSTTECTYLPYLPTYRGGWFPRRQLESSTCRDPRSTNAWDRTPALDD